MRLNVTHKGRAPNFSANNYRDYLTVLVYHLQNMEAYKAWVEDFSASILTWARPDHFPVTGSPMKDWPMASGYEAFTLAFGYLAAAAAALALRFSLLHAKAGAGQAQANAHNGRSLEPKGGVQRRQETRAGLDADGRRDAVGRRGREEQGPEKRAGGVCSGEQPVGQGAGAAAVEQRG